MPHTNNPNASSRARKAHRGNAPKFLQKKKSKGTALTTVDDQGNPVAPPALLANDKSDSRADKTALITEFHTIKKQLASPALKPADRQRLVKRQKELGGLEAYQAASVHGGDKSRGGESGKWCVKQLKELKVGLPDKGKQKEQVEPKILEDGTKVWPKVVREKLRLLDVGAINGTSYADWPWIDVTSIDLNAGSSNVIQCDFFDFPKPPADKLYDVVGLSLVVNFEGSLQKRAEMLYHAHSYLKPTGLLYLVLPLPCLTNSRYLSHARLESILRSTGWTKVRQHDSAKLTYWLCSRADNGRGDGQSWKREEVRKGVQRNNFCIIVDDELALRALADAVPSRGQVKDQGEVEDSEAKNQTLVVAEVEPVLVTQGDVGEEVDTQMDDAEEDVWDGIDLDEQATEVNAAEDDEPEEWGGIELDQGQDGVAQSGEDEEWGGIDL